MACFLVPTAEAIVTTIVKWQVEKKEAPEAAEIEKAGGKVSWKTKLSWLTNLLWGGMVIIVDKVPALRARFASKEA